MTLSCYAWSQTNPSQLVAEKHCQVNSIPESDALAAKMSAEFHKLYDCCKFVIVLLRDDIQGNNDDFVKTYEDCI